MTPDLSGVIHRVPRLIAILGLIGAGIAGRTGGFGWASAFFVGAVAAYFNFRLIERFVNRLVRAMVGQPGKRPRGAGFRLFIQLGLFVAGAFVILRFSGINLVVAFCGFLVCPAAVMLESIYYLFTYYGHS
ncbi:MAG TPA: ATP synthase subunit I [Bryobacteraceae bacterium]|nr:ATP synthase subunit I [Bryobacteraceae bacterium]